MKLRARIHRWHSPTIFTLIALCFVLPFGSVLVVGGCDGTNLDSSTKFTGAQLVTHTVPRGGKDPDCSHDISVCVERVGSTAAEIAFGAAIVGLFLGLLGIARGPGWCAVVGLIALLALLLGLMNLQEDDVSPQAGYGLALLLFLWAGVVHLRRAIKRASSPNKPPRPQFLLNQLGPPPSKGEPYV